MFLALLAAACILRTAPAGAAVGGSAHDLVAQTYDTLKGEDFNKTCGACHMRQSRKGWNLLQNPPAVLASYATADLTCFSCHDGTTLVSPFVDASRTAFHPGSHGFTVPEELGEAVRASGLPLTAGGSMSCQTCHDPHDNTTRPFLRSALDAICTTCHSGLTGAGGEEEAVAGNHPLGRGDPSGESAARAPVEIVSPFRVPFPSPYPLQNGKSALGVHWKLGGHLEKGGEGRVLCATCHAVHGSEEESPRGGLLSMDPVRRTADLFCEGCHRGQRGDGGDSALAPNPGASTTARTYHPADDDSGNGPGRLVAVTEPAGWPFGEGNPAPVLCTTCHRPHGADPDTALLRRPVESTDFCGSCHQGVPAPYHHPAGDNIEGPCVGEMPVFDGAAPNSLPCRGCHQAHNAGLGEREELFVPLLKQELTSMDFCYTCHPEDDPSCGSDPAQQASHFLGDSTLPDTYGLAEASLRKGPWPASGEESSYGGAEEGEVVCLSCHTFKPGAVLADDGRGGHLLARSGKNVEWEDAADPSGTTGYNNYLCTGCHLSRGTTGPNHPLMSADLQKLKGEPTPPVTMTSGGHLNCDSCHRPHGARTASGYYILEDVQGSNTDPKTVHPRIDFTVLCHHCHDAKDY